MNSYFFFSLSNLQAMGRTGRVSSTSILARASASETTGRRTWAVLALNGPSPIPLTFLSYVDDHVPVPLIITLFLFYFLLRAQPVGRGIIIVHTHIFQNILNWSKETLSLKKSSGQLLQTTLLKPKIPVLTASVSLSLLALHNSKCNTATHTRVWESCCSQEWSPGASSHHICMGKDSTLCISSSCSLSLSLGVVPPGLPCNQDWQFEFSNYFAFWTIICIQVVH